LGEQLRRIQGLFLPRPVNFSWVAPNIAASGLPATRRHLAWIKAQGITAVLSLTVAPLKRGDVEKLGLRYKHIPLQNHHAPPIEKLKEAVNYLREVVEAGGKVLVHCAAGLGRTGTVLAAYFIITRRMTHEEAVQLVRRLRPGSIEDSQIEPLEKLSIAMKAGS